MITFYLQVCFFLGSAARHLHGKHSRLKLVTVMRSDSCRLMEGTITLSVLPRGIITISFNLPESVVNDRLG